MNVEEFNRYCKDNKDRINRDIFRQMDFQVTGNDDYGEIGEEIERFPIYHPRRRRGYLIFYRNKLDSLN